MEGTPNNKVSVASLFTGKKGVLFAVPGAFTPGCDKVCVLLDVKHGFNLLRLTGYRETPD